MTVYLQLCIVTLCILTIFEAAEIQITNFLLSLFAALERYRRSTG